MQPKPMAELVGPFTPSDRVSIESSSLRSLLLCLFPELISGYFGGTKNFRQETESFAREN
jgi:hypothetical protein